MLVLGVELWQVSCVWVRVTGNKGVVRCREAELPASPDDATVGADVAARDATGDTAIDQIHAEGFFDEFDACGEREAARNGRVDCGGFVDGVAAEVAHKIKYARVGSDLLRRG